MKKFILLFCVMSLTWAVNAQTNDNLPLNIYKTSAPDGRYELMKIGDGGCPIKLDKQEGTLWYLASKKGEGKVWQEIERPVAENDSKKSGQINYQLFIADEQNYICYLLNINTGTTWRLVTKWDPRYALELIR